MTGGNKDEKNILYFDSYSCGNFCASWCPCCSGSDKSISMAFTGFLPTFRGKIRD
jgi:hypothetical protein